MIDRILIVLCGAALALGATACQDIIFPPNGNGGGNGSGGNGRPDTVVSSKDTLFLEGTVVSDGSALPLTLPRLHWYGANIMAQFVYSALVKSTV
jgi:hypothetical protein